MRSQARKIDRCFTGQSLIISPRPLPSEAAGCCPHPPVWSWRSHTTSKLPCRDERLRLWITRRFHPTVLSPSRLANWFGDGAMESFGRTTKAA
jgi:hypothetical protein